MNKGARATIIKWITSKDTLLPLDVAVGGPYVVVGGPHVVAGVVVIVMGEATEEVVDS